MLGGFFRARKLGLHHFAMFSGDRSAMQIPSRANDRGILQNVTRRHALSVIRRDPEVGESGSGTFHHERDLGSRRNSNRFRDLSRV